MDYCFNSGVYKITLKDISKKTGYSVNTVSHALNNKPDISDKTRNYIIKTANEMGYIRNSLAGGLRSGISKTIAVIISDISNPIFGIIVKKIEVLLREFGYNIFIMNTNEDSVLEEKAIFSALSHNVDGFIICPTQNNADVFIKLKESKIPFVLLGRRFENENMNSVIWDDLCGGYDATKFLISLGHKRILYVSGSKNISSSFERLKGYKKALNEFNIKQDDNMVYEISLVGDKMKHDIECMLQKAKDFTAIFAYNDIIAWEIIYQLKKMGKRVPQDVSVIGFDGIQTNINFPTQLSTVNAPKTKMAQMLVETLMNAISTNCKDSIEFKIPVTLLINDTTWKL